MSDKANENPGISRRDFLKGLIAFAGTSGIVGTGGLKLMDWIFGYVPETIPESGFYPAEPIKLPGGQTLSLVGVSHNHVTYGTRSEEIRERINNSDLVLMEYFYEENRLQAVPSFTVPETQGVNLDASSHLFFSGVGADCARAGKNIAVVNPETAESQLLEIFQLFCVIPGSIAAGRIKVNEKQRLMNRKEFLLFAWSSLVAVWDWAGWVGKMNESIKEGEEKFATAAEKNYQGTNPNIFRFTYLDWRDVATAKNILEFSEGHSCKDRNTNWSMFQGEYHTRGMLDYLATPELCRMKAGVYTLYNLTANRGVPVWTYDNNAEKWIQTIP